MRILLVYRSGEGQTRKLAEHVATHLRAAGAQVDVHDASSAPAPGSEYDGVVLGDSIHYSKHSKELTAYARKHAGALNAMTTAYFQVSMSAAGEGAAAETETRRLVDKLVSSSGWSPKLVGTFAGALAYSKYGWFKRRMMRVIAARQGVDTDSSRDHEYTDWGAVDAFAEDVLARVRGQRS